MGQMPNQAQEGQPPAKRPMPAPSQSDGEGEDEQRLLDQVQGHINKPTRTKRAPRDRYGFDKDRYETDRN
jgi:hypothetical protein